MRQYIILFGALLNVSLMAFEWDHVSGMCDAKMGASKTLTLKHIENAQIGSIEKIRAQNIDIITFDIVSDELYDELKEDYAHFYIGTGDSGTSCIASKYEIDPFLTIKDGNARYFLEEGLSFEVIVAAAKDTKSDKDEDKKTVSRGKWEITAKGDSEGKITLEGEVMYKRDDSDGSAKVSGAVSVSRDEKGKVETKGEISVGGTF